MRRLIHIANPTREGVCAIARHCLACALASMLLFAGRAALAVAGAGDVQAVRPLAAGLWGQPSVLVGGLLSLRVGALVGGGGGHRVGLGVGLSGIVCGG